MKPYWFPRQTKSGYAYGYKWRAQHRDKQTWAEEFLAIREKGPFNRVHIVALRARELDKDNFMAGLKPVIDAMKYRGLIEDDRPSVCHITATLIWGVKPYGVMVGFGGGPVWE